MWMVGYNDGVEFNMPDSFHGRKLRPLIPRPLPSPNNPSRTQVHGTDFFALNHHLATMGDQNKKDFNAQPLVVSSRWNPTPEQLRTLEEMYRRGTRTPSADQIQHITAQLRKYGKIEGKNVFYWFQNHKARERQKRRRQMESVATDEHNRDVEILERKDSGANRTGYEVEQSKNWTTPMNCSTLAEESVSMTMAAKAAVAECRQASWIQLDGAELHHRRNNCVERNATWQRMNFTCPASTHLINTSTSTTTTSTATTMASLPTSIRSVKTSDLMNKFFASCRENSNGLLNHLSNLRNDEDGCGESQTLQLFPLRSGDSDNATEKQTEISVAAMNANLTPSQFFEFLPLKK